MKGFHGNIEKEALQNENFRKVLYTGKNSQLVLMSLKPGEEIGLETHDDIDQFIRVEAGQGKAVIDDNEYELQNGSAVIVPSGARHNIVNTGDEAMKIYTIYSPAHHMDKTIHPEKADAISDDEEFDGKTSE